MIKIALLGGAVAVALAPAAMAQDYKMTTPIAPGVATPNHLDSSIGPLDLDGGTPTPATVEKIYDNLDRSRALQAYLLGIPMVNQAGMRDTLRKSGPDNQTDVIWETLVNPRTVELTANDNTVYSFIWLDTHKGPLVVEIPPKVLGAVDDFWYKWVADIGITGADHGAGGKYLILPPGYKADVPRSYFVVRPSTYGSWMPFRSFLVDGSPTPGVEAVKSSPKSCGGASQTGGDVSRRERKSAMHLSQSSAPPCTRRKRRPSPSASVPRSALACCRRRRRRAQR
jgi:hypothetical protein